MPSPLKRPFSKSGKQLVPVSLLCLGALIEVGMQRPPRWAKKNQAGVGPGMKGNGV